MDAAREDDWRAEVSERTRGERAEVDLPSRIVAAAGARLSVSLRDGTTVAGTVTDCAQSWLLLVDDSARQHLVPMGAVAIVSGISGAAHHLTEVERRLGLSHVLRALSRDRARVRVRVAGGELTGVIGGVRADHIDISTDESVRRLAAVPLAAILEVVST